MLDAKIIQKDFPILNREVNGKRLVYLDNAATTQKPEAILEAAKAYYDRSNSNIHRGIHTLSEEATKLYEATREKVAQFIGAASPEGVILPATPPKRSTWWPGAGGESTSRPAMKSWTCCRRSTAITARPS